ncbi:MAG: hypothetical protein OXU78_03995 [Deltaproteobacteria bacterium]|nr:hypothetical protein [Deltaproteobacteria bacterium]
MNTRLALLAICGAALLALGAAAQEQGGAPQTNEDLPRPVIQQDERLEEPGQRQRQRFEERRRRLQQLGRGEEFSEFDSETLATMELERRKALARGELQKQSGMPVEQQIFEDSLNEFGLWGQSLCFSEEPDLSNHEDHIPHRQLVRLDFRARNPSDLRRSINSRGRLTAAYSVIEMSCVLNVALSSAGGESRVRAISVRYFPLFSRRRSWWNTQEQWHASRVLAHQQGHFDLAELLARESTRKAAAVLGRIRGVGPNAERARADFQQRWAVHMRMLQDELRELERAYDRDTEHGADTRRQRAWRTRLKRGYAAVQSYLPNIPAPPRPAAATPAPAPPPPPEAEAEEPATGRPLQVD